MPDLLSEVNCFDSKGLFRCKHYNSNHSQKSCFINCFLINCFLHCNCSGGKTNSSHCKAQPPVPDSHVQLSQRYSVEQVELEWIKATVHRVWGISTTKFCQLLQWAIPSHLKNCTRYSLQQLQQLHRSAARIVQRINYIRRYVDIYAKCPCHHGQAVPATFSTWFTNHCPKCIFRHHINCQFGTWWDQTIDFGSLLT